MSWLSRISKTLDTIGLAIGSASCGVLFVLTMMQMGARLLNIPFYYANEYSTFLMVFIVLLPLGAVTRTFSHLSADFLLEVVGPRTEHFLRNVLGPLLTLIFAGILLALAVSRTRDAWVDGLRSDGPLRTPLVIPQLGMVFGLFLMFVAAALIILHRNRKPD